VIKYHVVRTKDARRAAMLVRVAPPHLREKRNGHPGGSGVRTFAAEGIVCTNFQGSSELLEPGRYQIDWKTLEDGIEVGTVRGISI
jgi:hypothetical protein